MEQNVKKRFYSIAFVICIGLFLSNFPFAIFLKDKYLCVILSIILKVISLITILVCIKIDNLAKPKFEKVNKKHLIYLPFILVCFGNLLACLLDNATNNSQIDYKLFILNSISCLFACVIEEILFRGILTAELFKNGNKNKAILISSIIFGAIHLLNISSISTIVPSLLQVAYTFGLGLILSYMYLDSNNIILPTILHFMFNFFNDTLVNTFFNLKWNLPFFIVNISIVIISIIYGLFIYKTKEKRE